MPFGSHSSTTTTLKRNHRGRIVSLLLLTVGNGIRLNGMDLYYGSSSPPQTRCSYSAGNDPPVVLCGMPHGIPTIEAASLDDLFFAQGFATAQDRLWQMDGRGGSPAATLPKFLARTCSTRSQTTNSWAPRGGQAHAPAIPPSGAQPF